MFIKIEGDYVNMDLIIDVCSLGDKGCKICFINKEKSTFSKTSADEFMKEFERQSMLTINKITVKPSIEDRFKLMDLDE